ncbi:hypothetical protein [Novosphingobium sp. BL-52-GroH]|uniref:hypothetical protein n=1 Tax=Novosphingobium sp. BL-52-GroH TaxID=3349877 RepID=UPI00384B4289
MHLRTSRRASGEVVLAPLYDLVATRAWEELSPRLAMRFGGASRLEDIDAESFARFAQDAGLTAPFVRRRAVTVEAAIGGRMAVPELPEGITAALAEATAERAARLALEAR